MKKRILFQTNADLIIFKDVKSEFSFFGITKEVYDEVINIAGKFSGKEINVPDEHSIKVSPIKYFGPEDNYTDIYKTSDSGLIDFPINRIEWIFIQIVFS